MTPSKEEIAALVERVRGLKGPDREVDAAIYVVATEILGNGHPDAVIHDFGTCVAIRHDGWPWVPTEDEPDPGSWHGVDFAPNFTSSVDAALALLERMLPGWGVETTTPAGGGKASCRIYPGSSLAANASRTAFGSAPTPPLAIILALLLSLQSQEPTP